MACTRTYSGLCIYSPGIKPDEITARLGVEPTRHFERDVNSKYKPNREHNFWLWSTQDLIDSTDHLDHLAAIFSQFGGKEADLAKLRSEECTTSISCYWDSDGQGGPWLSPEILRKLSDFGVDIWYDIYFDSPGSSNRASGEPE